MTETPHTPHPILKLLEFAKKVGKFKCILTLGIRQKTITQFIQEPISVVPDQILTPT